MRPQEPQDTDGESSIRPIRGVLFDFHGTLAQVEPLTRSVELAAEAAGHQLPPYGATVLADALGALGWVGSGQPAKVLPAFAQAWADRDLSETDHREAFLGIARQTSGAFEGFAEGVYARLCAPDGWIAYADTISTLTALRESGVPVALVSNIGFDVRPVAKHLGFAHLIDHWVLSYEVRWCKPEPAIFREACLQLGVEPENAMMVGDTLADAGARELGIRTFLVPHADPGATVGLEAVRQLACG